MNILLKLSPLLTLVLSTANAAASYPVTVTVEGTTLAGDLYLPKKTKDPLPLVIVIHEWWGKTGYPQARAKQISEELGYAALAVDLYGDAKTVSTPAEAQALATPFYQSPSKAVKRLHAFIAAAPEVARKASAVLDLRNTAAVGFCFGGSQALNLARSGPLPGEAKLDAVVAFHAGLASSLKSASPMEPKILVLHGEADPMVKKEEVTAFKEEMRKAGTDLKFVSYPGATHAFTNPRATEMGKKHDIPIAYDRKAAEGSWKEMKSFLKAHLNR